MLTGLVTLLVALVPGALLGLALPAGTDRWVAWSAAPVLTLGLTAAGIAWLPLVGLPDGALPVFALELLLAVVAVVLARVRRGRRRAAGGSSEGRARLPRRTISGLLNVRPDLLGVLLPAALNVGVAEFLLGPLGYPPGWDAMNHGLLTRNIIASGSVQISSVCTTGSTHTMVSCRFYPIAVDVSWAQTATLSGAHISTAMLAWLVLVGPLALVVALYGLVRALGGRPLTAGCVGMLAAVIGPMWSSLERGRPPESFAAALSVAIAALAVRSWRGSRPVGMGLLAGVGCAGLLMTHTYDLLFAATLAIACALTQRGRLRLRAAVLGCAALAVATLLLIGPLLGAISGAANGRTAVPPSFPGDVPAAVRFWILDVQRYTPFAYPWPGYGGFGTDPWPVRVVLALVIVCLAASPLSFVFARLRWARGWLACGVLWTAVGIWTDVSTMQVARLIAGTWYSVDGRLWVMILPVYATLTAAGAAALGLSAQRLVQLVPIRSARSARVIAPITLALLSCCVVAVALSSGSGPRLRADLSRFAPSGGSYPRTYAWLARHLQSGHVVAWAQHADFMTWAYVDHGVRPLFGITPLVPASKSNYAARFAAFDWLVNKPAARPAGCLVRTFRIEYLALGSPHVPGIVAYYRPSRVAASPRVRLVHRDGNVRVYRVTPAGAACGQ